MTPSLRVLVLAGSPRKGGNTAVSVYKKGAVKDMPQALLAAYELGQKCAEAMRPTPQ